MANRLSGRTVAMLATNGFEESELTEPREALRSAGATVEVLSTSDEPIRAWRRTDWGGTVPVDRTLDEVTPDDFDGLVLPGGVMNPDKLRMDESAVDFVRAFVESGKPVAAICHAPWLLAEADVLHKRRVTSYGSLMTDLENAGASWVDEQVVRDGNLITSRSPADLPAFCDAVIDMVGTPQGPHTPAEIREHSARM